MRSKISDRSASLLRTNHKKQIWLRIVSVMASVVVFCTTYALILPAITMTEDYYCGFDEHTHTEECYQDHAEKTSICQAAPHEHTAGCYNAGGAVICGQADVFVHTHSDICYDGKGELACTLTAVSTHQHSESCYLGETVYGCGMEETEGHLHDTTCYTEQKKLVCDQEEVEAHQHAEECYGVSYILLCTQEECTAHAHAEGCYGTEDILICQMAEEEAHLHSDACYGVNRSLTCTQQEHESHTHSDICYGTERTLACGLEESEDHTHGEACWYSQSVLQCGSEEYAGHTHSDSCYSEERVLQCGRVETTGHSHEAACYESRQTVTCTLAETEGHTHDAACYKQERSLQCTKEETEGHTHADSCYETEALLSCEQEEQEPHSHSELCGIVSEPVLVCNIQQIKTSGHTAACYDESGNLICETLVAQTHAHTEECFHIEEVTEPTLICGMEEHTHVLACTSNKDADVETADIWRRTVPAADTLTGTLNENLLAVAKSQLGYQESSRNFEVDGEDHRRGYTRYGHWYGSPYGDWCAMYVSFCLHYAQIPDEVFPYHWGCTPWFQELDEMGIYHAVDEEYIPVPGDVIFFTQDSVTSSHVGIVSDVTDTEITTIEGNSSNCVKYNTYSLPNGEGYILGYASMDEAYRRGVELELIAPIPEETVPDESEPETVFHNTEYQGIQIQVQVLAAAEEQEETALLLSAEEPEAELLSLIDSQLEQEHLAFRLRLTAEQEETAGEMPAMLTITPAEKSVSDIYILTDGDAPEMNKLESVQNEDGTLSAEVTQLGVIILGYAKEENDETEPTVEPLSLESSYDGLRFKIVIPADAISQDSNDLALQVEQPEQEALNILTQQLDVEYTPFLLSVKSGEDTIFLSVPVELTITRTEAEISDETELSLYYLGEGDSTPVTLVESVRNEDGSITAENSLGVFALTNNSSAEELEESAEPVLLEAEYNGILFKLTIPAEVITQDRETLSFTAAAPEESIRTTLDGLLAEEFNAVSLSLMAEGEEIVPAVAVQLTILPVDAGYSVDNPPVFYSLTKDEEPAVAALAVEIDENGAAVLPMEELGTLAIVPPEKEKEPVSLETTCGDITIRLDAPAEAFPDGENLSLVAAVREEDVQKLYGQKVGGNMELTALDIQILNGEEAVQPAVPVQLTFEMAGEKTDYTLYQIGEAVEVASMEETTESSEPTETATSVQTELTLLGTCTEEAVRISVEVSEAGAYLLASPIPFEGEILEAVCGNLNVKMQIPAGTFANDPQDLVLHITEKNEEITSILRGSISAYRVLNAVDIAVMSGETVLTPELPVRLEITGVDGAFDGISDISVWKVGQIVNLTTVETGDLTFQWDESGIISLETTDYASLAVIYEEPFDGIQLHADYGDIHIRLRAPEDAFPVTAENLSLKVTEPGQSMRDTLAQSMDGEEYFAVDIQILCDGQPIQPNGDVQVIFEIKNDPFPDADAVEIYHAVEDEENQSLYMTEVEGGYNDNGDVEMETNHFSTYVVSAANAPVMLAAETPTNTWQEALTDRSGNVGVESEGYTDSPYTKTRQFNGTNITALTSTGGTVYVGNSKLLNYGFYAERYWDGTKPVRITSTDPDDRATLTRTMYADWFLEDNKAPNAPLKIDNIHLETNFAGMNIYGRGNKIVIGENVTTESGENFRIYGGSDTNNSTTSCPTNVVVESGNWHLVCGGGHGDIPNGTTVTVRGDANITTLYGGGTERSTVGTPDGQNTDVNIYVEGGNIGALYGGNRVEKEGCAIYEDINIEVTGGHVGILCAGNDYTHVDNPEEWEESYVQGNVTVTIKNGGSATQVIGDPYHTPYTRSIKGATILECYENEKFNILDQWDVVRIIGDGTPNSTTVETLDTTGGKYIGRIEVNNGGRLFLDMNGYINILNEKDQTLIPLNDGSEPYELKHAWAGEASEERRNLSTLAVLGNESITPSGGYLFDPDEGKAGLRIKGNVEGFSTLEAVGEPMYSTGDTYYYYVVADSSDNGGKAFREPEGAPYVVCYRYLEDGRIGWYLRERPTLTLVENKLLRVGTDGQMELNDQAQYGAAPSNYIYLMVDMKGFAYEWSSNPLKNRVDLTWTITEGSSNATITTGGVSIQTLADIQNNLLTTSNPNGIFCNAVYGVKGTDEGSTEVIDKLSSFIVVLDTSTAIAPRYYSVDANFHYVGDAEGDDVRWGGKADAARCTYDFAKTDEPLGDDGYTDSVMTTYAYKDDVPPKGKDDALLRVHIPEGVMAGSFTVSESDNIFTFTETQTQAKLVPYGNVSANYETEDAEVYNKQFGVTLQEAGSSEKDLSGRVTASNLSGTKKFNCWVYSHGKIDYTDISLNNGAGLELQLQLNNLTKNGTAVGTNNPAATNQGELQIQVLPVGTVIETVKIAVEKQVTGASDGHSAEFQFLLTYPKNAGNTLLAELIPGNDPAAVNEEQQIDETVVEERFTLKHGEIKEFMVPVGVRVTIQEIEHDGYYVQIQEEDGEMVYKDTIELTATAQTTDEVQKVTFYNSAGVELPESGGAGTQIHTFLGLLLTLGAIALFWMHRRERGTVC